MRILIILTILLLGGCASDYEARERADNLHDARVSIRNQCGTDAACVDKMKNAYFQAKERTAAQEGQQKIPKGWTKERMAEADELNALGKRWRQQYIAAKRPVFRLKFRHEYPSMSDEEIEVLVNDALEEGLQETMQKNSERLFDEPDMRSPIVMPPVSCTSSQMGRYTYTDCY